MAMRLLLLRLCLYDSGTTSIFLLMTIFAEQLFYILMDKQISEGNHWGVRKKVALSFARKYSRSEKLKFYLVFRSLNRTFAAINSTVHA